MRFSWFDKVSAGLNFWQIFGLFSYPLSFLCKLRILLDLLGRLNYMCIYQLISWSFFLGFSKAVFQASKGALGECFCCGQCTPAGPYEQQKKFALVEVTGLTVAIDPCTFEGPSPGGDGSLLPGT